MKKLLFALSLAGMFALGFYVSRTVTRPVVIEVNDPDKSLAEYKGFANVLVAVVDAAERNDAAKVKRLAVPSVMGLAGSLEMAHQKTTDPKLKQRVGDVLIAMVDRMKSSPAFTQASLVSVTTEDVIEHANKQGENPGQRLPFAGGQPSIAMEQLFSYADSIRGQTGAKSP